MQTPSTTVPLEKTNLNLKDYHGRLLELKGVTWVPIQYEEQKRKLPLVIAAGNRPPLFGRNWLKAVQLNWPKICTNDMKRQAQAKDTEVEKIIQRRRAVFEERYSVIKEFTATLHLKPEAKSVFRKTRPAPYAMQEAITTKLDRLERNNIITKVVRSEWATPTVNIRKKDKCSHS